jgi:hypothetical protein
VDRLQHVRRSVSTLLVSVFALGAFLVPGAIVAWTASDAGLGSAAIPGPVWFWHRSLSKRFEPWARARTASGAAARAQTSVSGTEWPLFGTVFYLLATEELEREARELEAAGNKGAPRPSVYARGAIDAAAALVADPVEASWVKAKYGPDYLHRENVFYRYLLIFGLGSYETLTGDRRYRALLADQTDSLAKEFLAAPRFLLDDYPGECWPSDCLWAVAAIRRSDRVLGTDHSALVAHALRNLKGKLLDENGLPPYMADKLEGTPIGKPRGCSCSSILVFAPELSPELARQWYAAYERRFWQRAGLFDGFREHPEGEGADWGMDVDAGPIIMGHGVSACCFGIAAARANGRFDHARTLAGEAVAWAWPLPDGSLLVPKVLSNQIDAPLLGEAGVLFCLTRRPAPGMESAPPGAHSPQLYLLVALYVVTGLVLLWQEWRKWRRWGTGGAAASLARSKAAFAAWLLLMLAALVTFAAGQAGVALVFALFSLGLPERIAGEKEAQRADVPPTAFVPPDTSA